MITEKTKELTQAFHLFNELTQNLTESYQGLEAQVSKLRQQLAIARNDRLKTLIEKEKLANRLHKLLATLPAAVIVLDSADSVIDCNKVAVEYLGQNLMGCSWTTLGEQHLIPVLNNPHERQLIDGRRVSVSRSPLGDSEGQMILLTDVTEMRSLQDLVNQREHLSAMGEMVASMAHQVRTPLSTAILYASQLSHEKIDAEKKQNFSQKILERLHFLECQVNDMLIFAKEGRLAMEEFSLPTMFEKISDTVQEQLSNSDIQFSLTDSSLVNVLQGNENALRGAIMNLLNNAQHAMQNRGAIQLFVQRHNSNLRIIIKDDGPGISKAVQERIFDPFFTTRINGTGLGLAVVDSVIRAHGGSVECVSEPEKGAEFVLILPILNQSFIPNKSTVHSKIDDRKTP